MGSNSGRRRGRGARHTANSANIGASGGTARKQTTAQREGNVGQARPRPSTQSAPRRLAPLVKVPTSEPDSGSQLQPEPQPQATNVAPGSALYQHTAHPHQPRNVNHIHREQQAAAGLNTRVAVWLTKNVGTMQCAYIFAGIGIGSLVGVATNNVVLAAVFGSLSSYFLQLVLLPILSVGQNVLGRHQELQADEMFNTTQHSFHDIEEIMAHLSAQDQELLKQTKLLLQLGSTRGSDAGAAAAATEAQQATVS